MKTNIETWTNTMEGGRRIDPNRPWQRFDGEAVWQDQNGDTILGIKTSPKEVKHWDGKTYSTKYAVGTLRSVEAFGLGTFSAEIKLPKGRNLWPSFWLFGSGPWPDTGEIDIVEGYSSYGSYYRFPIAWATETNVHYELDGIHRQEGPRKVTMLNQPKNPAEHFIRYEVERGTDRIVFRFNGKKVREVCGEIARRLAAFDMHVVINLWTETEDFTLEAPMVVRSCEYTK